jgi:hypothetical protein
MKQIRRNVFETNSSSTHSISFSKKTGLDKSELEVSMDGYIYISLGEFGWEIENYYDQRRKLSYLVTMAAMLNGCHTKWCDQDQIANKITKFMESDDFERISKEIGDYTHTNGVRLYNVEGYIDHQSCEDYASLDDFLSQNDTNILDFVFGNVVVHTDNDNY